MYVGSSPTDDADGEYVQRCSRCKYEEITVLEKTSKPTEVSPTRKSTEPIETTEPTLVTEPAASEPIETELTPTEPEVTFEEIYKASKSNELAADDLYKGNRYRITATINGIESGGLFNLTGGATLTMQTQVDSTIVFFFAEFEKEQEDTLKKVAVGDIITFEGTCLSSGTWTDCVIVG